MPNGGVGILDLDASSGDLIDNNAIAYNSGGGIKLLSTALGTPNQIQISANSIHSNGGGYVAASGIDISPLDGAVNPNDNDAVGPANVPNAGLNFPALDVATGKAKSGTLSGTLATRNDAYTVEVFASRSCAASGYGEGEKFVGSAPVTIANASLGFNGSAQFTADIKLDSGTFTSYPVITATATDSNGNTSEFSQCVVYDHIFDDGFEAN